MRRPLCWMCVWIAGTLAAVLAGAVSVNGADETVTLRYRFEPGQSVYYRVDNESQFQEQFGTADETVKHSSQSLKHYTVISVEQDGSAVIELAIDRAQMQAVQNGGKATYDSASNQEPPEAFKGIQETIGRPWVRLHVTATGRVTRAVQIGKLPGKKWRW